MMGNPKRMRMIGIPALKSERNTPENVCHHHDGRRKKLCHDSTKRADLRKEPYLAQEAKMMGDEEQLYTVTSNLSHKN